MYSYDSFSAEEQRIPTQLNSTSVSPTNVSTHYSGKDIKLMRCICKHLKMNTNICITTLPILCLYMFIVMQGFFRISFGWGDLLYYYSMHSWSGLLSSIVYSTVSVRKQFLI